MRIPRTTSTSTIGPRIIPNEVQQLIKDNPGTPEPKPADLAVVFFETFSKENPGKFPSAVQHQTKDGKTVTVDRAGQGRHRHPVDLLRYVAAGSCRCSPCRTCRETWSPLRAQALIPISRLQNAEYQLDRVSPHGPRTPSAIQGQVRTEIEQILQANASAPFDGLVGEKFVNVLEVNLELRKHLRAASSIGSERVACESSKGQLSCRGPLCTGRGPNMESTA